MFLVEGPSLPHWKRRPQQEPKSPSSLSVLVSVGEAERDGGGGGQGGKKREPPGRGAPAGMLTHSPFLALKGAKYTFGVLMISPLPWRTV